MARAQLSPPVSSIWARHTDLGGVRKGKRAAIGAGHPLCERDVSALPLLPLSISRDLPLHPWQQEADRQRSLLLQEKANADVKGITGYGSVVNEDLSASKDPKLKNTTKK